MRFLLLLLSLVLQLNVSGFANHNPQENHAIKTLTSETLDCGGRSYELFRYYDPDTGNYLSQDPIGLNGGMQLYSYLKDTNTWLDPIGLTHSRSDALLHNVIQNSTIGNNRVELNGIHSVDDVMAAGEKFAGKNATIEYHPDGKIKSITNKDGLRRFRDPQYKPLQGYKQANFEMRTSTDVSWKSPVNIGTDANPIMGDNQKKSNVHVKCH